jgi:hypothetical protein
MGRIAYRQFGFQATVPDMLSAVRWWSICEQPELRHVLETRYHLDLPRIFKTFVGLFAYLDGDAFRLPPSSVEPAVGSEIAVGRILALTSATTEQHAQIPPSDLLDDIAYRESPLRRFPILRFESPGQKTSYCAPLRNPVWWRFTSGLYYDFAGLPDFQNRIGDQFEEYVRRLVSGTLGWQVEPKSTFRLVGHGTAETPDCVAVDAAGSIAAIIECKAVKSTLAAQINLISEAGVDRAITQIAKGIVQVAKYREFLLQERRAVSPNCLYAVVTLDDWMFLGGSLWEVIFDRAAVLASEQEFSSALVDHRAVVPTTSQNLERILAHYPERDVLRIFKSATLEFPGYELNAVPSALKLEPANRHPYVESLFERLMGMPAFREKFEARIAELRRPSE